MADSHLENELRPCIDTASASLTVPGRDPGGEVPPWPILRLGFAAWSIWTLALEGQEFGKLVANKEAQELARWADEVAAFGPDGVRTLVADTIGAWAEGPAYACALLLLTLDPSRVVGVPEQDHVSDSERAALVMSCLRNQIVQSRATAGLEPEQAGMGHGYIEFLEGVEARWKAALQAAGADGPVAVRQPELEQLRERVWRHFDLKFPFELENWATAKKVWEALSRGDPLPDELIVRIRHLTNAAWYARYSSTDPDLREIETLTLGAGRDVSGGQRTARDTGTAANALKSRRGPGL
jgi:hypothetical protein